MRELVAHVAERYGPEGWPVPTTEQARPENFDDKFWTVDNTKSKEILHVQYRPIAETILDMAAMMIERGVVTKPAAQ